MLLHDGHIFVNMNVGFLKPIIQTICLRDCFRDYPIRSIDLSMLEEVHYKHLMMISACILGSMQSILYIMCIYRNALIDVVVERIHIARALVI